MDPFASQVREYMTAPVLTASADATLDDVLAILHGGRVTSVAVVGRDGRAVGVLSYSDLLQIGRFYTQSARGRALLQLPSMCAGDLVRPGMIGLGPDATLVDAARLLRARGVQRVYVLEHGRAVGVLSTRDLMRAIGEAELAAPIGEVMRSPVPVLEASAPATSAVNLVPTSPAVCVVVLEAGLIAGVVTQKEALAARDLDKDTLVGAIVGYSLIRLNLRTPVYRAARFVQSTRARRVVVTDQGKICGILSGLDFAEAILRASPAPT